MLAKRTLPIVSLLILGSLPSIAEDTSLGDIPYGIEALAQYRSEYNYRGFKLAQSTVDFQIGARYAFNDSTSLTATAWHGSATGKGDFSEAGFQTDLSKDINDFTFTLSGTYRSYGHSFFESGVNLETSVNYHLSDNLDIESRFAYDSGSEGLYGDLALHYYIRLTDDAYIALSSGASYVDDYYQRDGFNDAFAKVSYTYNINQSVSITPYAGSSVLLDNEDTGSDSLYGGVYFAVSF